MFHVYFGANSWSSEYPHQTATAVLGCWGLAVDGLVAAERSCSVTEMSPALSNYFHSAWQFASGQV